MPLARLRMRPLLASLLLHTCLFGAALGFGIGFGLERDPPPRLEIALQRHRVTAELPPEPEERIEPVPEAAPPAERLPPPPREPLEPFVVEAVRSRPAEGEEPPPVPWRAWITRVVRPERGAAPVPEAVQADRARAAEPRPLGRNRPPRYPKVAIRRGLEGVVLVQVHVDRQGNVSRCILAQSSGYRVLDESALRTLAGWRFSRGPGKTRIPVVFRLD